MKYKVGDKVRIIKNKSYHNFPIGEIITIEDIDDDFDDDLYSSEDKNRDIWYYSEDEIELVGSGDNNMECNYEMIGKRETIECLLNGKIDKNEISNIYVVDMSENSIVTLNRCSFYGIMECIEDKSVMFFQLKEEN